jgi:hypothetical protein
MSTPPWILDGDVVRLNDETDSVRIGAGPAPTRMLEVNGTALVSLQDRGGNVFDVKAFGARGDGLMDDVPSITEALAALTAAGGGTLYFPPGRYLVLSEVAITGNVPIQVCGAGPQVSVIQLRNPVQGLPSTHNALRFRWTLASASDRELYMEVRDLRFEPATAVADPTAGAAIRQECDPFFQNTFMVRNCWFRRVFTGINLTQAGSAIISGCQFVDPQHAGILLEQLFPGPIPGDVGAPHISDCFFFDKPPESAAPFAVLATSGAAGIRLHHNTFVRFQNPVMIDFVDGALHTALNIDDNLIDGKSTGAKIHIKGPGEITSFNICNNQINFGTHGVLVELTSPTDPSHRGRLRRGVISGNVFNGAGGKGISFNPIGTSPTATEIREVSIADNHFSVLAVGIELANERCRAVSIHPNSFDDSVVTPLVNNGADGRGAFFADRIGVGRANNLAATKDASVYSNQPARPRLYLQGDATVVNSAPGIDFAFDATNTQRAGIVGRTHGTDVQLEFFTKPSNDSIKQRAVLDGDGNMLWTSGAYQEMMEMAADPAAPAADKARLFVRDNGAGKTQLCVRFATGAVVVLATQP